MSIVNLIVSTLLVASFAILILGMAWRVWLYASTPAPLRIFTAPAPATRAGAAFRVGREVTLFESLFRADKFLWLVSMLFHVGLLLVLLRHLRYFMAEPPLPVVLIQPLGQIGALMMMVGLIGLLARRLFEPRVRYVTSATDIGVLLLLLAIGASGLAMTFLFPTDIMGLKQYLAGLWRFDPQPLPDDPALIVHLLLVATLLVVAPYSKLLHLAGVFFSPTRNQRDDARTRRHVAAWARPLDQRRTRGSE
jgi:nitrate reductase gamma subunit